MRRRRRKKRLSGWPTIAAIALLLGTMTILLSCNQLRGNNTPAAGSTSLPIGESTKGGTAPTNAPPTTSTEEQTTASAATTTVPVTTVPPTTTAPPATPPPSIDVSNLDTTYNEWYNIRNSDHTTPGIQDNVGPWLAEYNAIFMEDPSQKTFYFTLDCGGDSGYANQILDILRDKNVKVTFFVTKPFITNNPDILNRMVSEGHTIGNHTVNHFALTTLTADEIAQELKGVEEAYTATTGQTMLKMMRPPMGAYTEKSLAITSQLGFKTVFWSIAYTDYDVNNQPSRDEAMSLIRNNHHNGAIILLHVGSKTNAETLGEMIDYLKGEGYSFGMVN